MSEYEPGRYKCPECKRDFDRSWINRHLVKEHGYRYWDNERVYKPIPVELVAEAQEAIGKAVKELIEAFGEQAQKILEALGPGVRALNDFHNSLPADVKMALKIHDPEERDRKLKKVLAKDKRKP